MNYRVQIDRIWSGVIRTSRQAASSGCRGLHQLTLGAVRILTWPHMRRYAFWSLGTVINFAMAAYLTVVITRVDHSPIASPNPVQVISVYEKPMSLLERRAYLVPKASPYYGYCSENTRVTIRYGEARPDIGTANPHLVIDVPPCVQLAVVIGRLAQRTCNVDHSTPVENDLVPQALPGTDLVVVKSARELSWQHIYCPIQDPVSRFTFTKRRVTFNIWRPPLFGLFGLGQPLKDYLSLSNGIILTIEEMAGADRVEFNNGTQDRSLPAFESSRVLAYAMIVTVSWIDTFQEQRRDVFLVLIGAFIALGATMLIEFLRLVVERES